MFTKIKKGTFYTLLLFIFSILLFVVASILLFLYSSYIFRMSEYHPHGILIIFLLLPAVTIYITTTIILIIKISKIK